MECYRDWAAAYTSSSMPLSRLLCALPYMNIPQRKAVLTYTRVRPTKIEGSRFHVKMAKELSSFVDFYYGFESKRPMRQTCMVKTLLSDLPENYSLVMYSILSAASRMAPYDDYTSVGQVRETTIEKELIASQTASTNADLDFRCITSPYPLDRNIRMFPNLPLNPKVHEAIHKCLSRSRDLLVGKMVFPKISDKSIGEESQRVGTQMAEAMGVPIEFSKITSTVDVERLYHTTGIVLEGLVEMRAAWKYNDLKPRVYYAQGPTVFKHSKYIQAIFNVIIDCFEVTHRTNRYSIPNDCILEPVDRLVIYDYSSFTTNLGVIKKFTRALADFYAGTKVVLIDSFRGPEVHDLGDLLAEYTATCNEFSLFDARKVVDSVDEFLILHDCGMLGVPGNISSSTLLHGIHLCIIIEALNRGRCVGDDALAKVIKGLFGGNWRRFQSGVRNLGDVEDDKYVYWDVDADEEMDGWHYIKNPMVRADSRVVNGISLICPSIAIILGLEDKFHTIDCPNMVDRQKIFIAQWTRFLDRFRMLTTTLSELDEQLLFRFQVLAYRHLDLKGGGYIQVLSGPRQRSLLAPTKMSGTQFLQDWRSNTLPFLRNSDQTISVPTFRQYDDSWTGRQEEVFISRSTGLLRWLVQMGYAEKELLTEDIPINSIDDNLAMFYMSRRYTYSYTFSFMVDVPSWIDTVQLLLLMSPHERISYLP